MSLENKTPVSDKLAIMTILAGLIKNPLLFADNNYKFSIDDFPDSFHKIIFGAVEYLAKNGLEKIDFLDIDQFLKNYPTQYAVFVKNKGVEFIQDILKMYDEKKFYYSYQTVKKYSLINSFNKQGIDTRDILNEDEIDPVKKSKMQANFDAMTVNDIILQEETKLISIKKVYSSYTDRVENKAGDGLKELLESLKQKPEVGLPLLSPKLTTILRGQRRGCLFMESAPSGFGKALPNSSKIPTPKGWKTIGEIKVGDYLFDGLGRSTKVTDIFPQGKKEVYQVTFKDGRTVRCCKEHLWSFCLKGQAEENKANRIFYTKTLQQIIDTVPLKNKKGEWNVLVPQQKAVEYPENKNLLILPYVLGTMLGCKSTKEHIIPRNYLEDSVGHRWDLLNGLLDIKGNIDLDRGEVSFPIDKHDKEFYNNFIELTHSLGFSTYIQKNPQTDNAINYNIILIGSPELKKNLFKYPKKHKQLIKYLEKNQKEKLVDDYEFNSIVSIEKLNYEEEMTCFLVDNEEHLFLTDDFVVTHNTRRGMGEACHLAIPEYYDVIKQKWVRTNLHEQVLIISTELELNECQTMFTAFVAGVPENHIKDGRYTSEEEERVTKAADLIIAATNLHFISVTNFDATDIVNMIKEYKQLYNIGYCYFDYLGESAKITFGAAKQAGVKDLRTDQILLMFASALKDVAKTLDIYIWTATQLSGDYKNAKDLDATFLRSAKSLADKADVGIILMPIREIDRPIIDSYCARGFELIPTFVISVYKVRAGSYQNIKVYVYFDRSTCQITDCFVTDSKGTILPIEDTNIEIMLDNTKEEKFENAYNPDIDFEF